MSAFALTSRDFVREQLRAPVAGFIGGTTLPFSPAVKQSNTRAAKPARASVDTASRLYGFCSGPRETVGNATTPRAEVVAGSARSPLRTTPGATSM